MIPSDQIHESDKEMMRERETAQHNREKGIIVIDFYDNQ